MIEIYSNLSGKHENNETSKFYFRWGGLDEMNEIVI